MNGFLSFGALEGPGVCSRATPIHPAWHNFRLWFCHILPGSWRLSNGAPIFQTPAPSSEVSPLHRQANSDRALLFWWMALFGFAGNWLENLMTLFQHPQILEKLKVFTFWERSIRDRPTKILQFNTVCHSLEDDPEIQIRPWSIHIHPVGRIRLLY